jgi:hypothetical protein
LVCSRGEALLLLGLLLLAMGAPQNRSLRIGANIRTAIN